jgi:hypothetical protein
MWSLSHGFAWTCALEVIDAKENRWVHIQRHIRDSRFSQRISVKPPKLRNLRSPLCNTKALPRNFFDVLWSSGCSQIARSPCSQIYSGGIVPRMEMIWKLGMTADDYLKCSRVLMTEYGQGKIVKVWLLKDSESRRSSKPVLRHPRGECNKVGDKEKEEEKVSGIYSDLITELECGIQGWYPRKTIRFAILFESEFSPKCMHLVLHGDRAALIKSNGPVLKSASKDLWFWLQWRPIGWFSVVQCGRNTGWAVSVYAIARIWKLSSWKSILNLTCKPFTSQIAKVTNPPNALGFRGFDRLSHIMWS